MFSFKSLKEQWNKKKKKKNKKKKKKKEKEKEKIVEKNYWSYLNYNKQIFHVFLF